MPQVKLIGFDCNYLFEDLGHPETLIFSNSLGTNYTMWDENVGFLSAHFNIVRYDTRGHGGSSANQDAVSAAELGMDVIALLDHLKLGKVIFCGLSIGGLIGQWLGIHHPERFSHIILSNTAAKIGTREGWDSRIAQVKGHGLESILDGTAQRWFTDAYRADNPDKVSEILADFAGTSLRGYIACCTMVREADFTADLPNIDVPVLVICGAYDQVTTIREGELLQEQIPFAHLVVLEAAHLSNKENPETFANHIIYFTKHQLLNP